MNYDDFLKNDLETLNVLCFAKEQGISPGSVVGKRIEAESEGAGARSASPFLSLSDWYSGSSLYRYFNDVGVKRSFAPN